MEEQVKVGRVAVRLIGRLTLIGIALIGACSHQRAAAPAANQVSRVPDLTGQSVLLLPVQSGAVPGPTMTAPGNLQLHGVSELDAELAYWPKERAPMVRWTMPESIDRTLARNPAIDIKPRALEVSAFRRAQVKRIGDPLFGDLRRLAAILDARYALVPVAAEFKPTAGGKGHIETALALIDTGFGDVLWFGVLAGEEGVPGSSAVAASTAQRIANTFAPRQ